MNDMLEKIFYCVVIAIIGFVLAKISKWLIVKLFNSRKSPAIKSAAKAETLKSVAVGAISALIYILAVLTILYELKVPMTSIAAVSGSIAVAVGLGAQNLISDIIAGTFILFENQFNVGDIVTLNECTGTVEKMTLRTTRVRNSDGTVYVIPNGSIVVVTNKCKEFMNASVDIRVGPEEDIDRVLEILEEEMDLAFEEVEGLFDRPNVLGISDFSEIAVVVKIVAKCEVKANYSVERELRLRIKRRFTKEDINIPYSQRKVYFVNSEE